MGKIKLDPYLFFKGNCREALEFYAGVFGGQAKFMSIADGPPFPGSEKFKPDHVMHGWLEGTDFMLMASDSHEASDKTAKVELCLNGDDEDEAKLRGYWDELVEDGTVRMPLEKAPWGSIFGGLTDKYGIDWMFNIGGGE